jgi:hypothetical protein
LTRSSRLGLVRIGLWRNGRLTSKPVKLKRGFGPRDAPSSRDRTAAGRSQQAPDRELRKRPSAGASWGAEEYNDARDVATALLGSQKKASCAPSLYADVKVQTLTDATEEKPTRENILKAIDVMAQNMRRAGSERDVALVLPSTHGAMMAANFTSSHMAWI